MKAIGIFLCLVILFLLISCNHTDEGVWYRKHMVKVEFSSGKVDTLYEMAHSSAWAYMPFYTNKDSQYVELRDNCIITRLATFPKSEK